MTDKDKIRLVELGKLDSPGHQHGEQSEDRLHDPGQRPDEEGLPLAHPLLTQGQGDRRPLGEVLDADSQGQGGGSGPEANLSQGGHSGTLGVMAGFLIMMILDVALG